jgi:hypothetical protein
MKELRAKTVGHIIAYYFNNRRQGILLIGGNPCRKI